MTAILEEICRPSEVHDLTTATNLAKEAMQEMILCTLSKDGFFDIALFHGGTCLRILHGLDRFSEDLDFTLLAEDRDFDFTPYSGGIIRAFRDIGVNVHNSPRPPRGELQVFSDKIKVNLREMLGACGFADRVVRAAHSQENCVVKIDVDICTPGYTRDEVVHKSAPLEYSVRPRASPCSSRGRRRPSCVAIGGSASRGGTSTTSDGTWNTTCPSTSNASACASGRSAHRTSGRRVTPSRMRSAGGSTPSTGTRPGRTSRTS